jgi:uncharacterized membrane protein
MSKGNPRGAKTQHSRRAAIAVLSAILMVAMLGMVAFGVDVGYMMVVRTQLQTAADSAALAAAAIMGQGMDDARTVARKYSEDHQSAGEPVRLADTDIEFGIWDVTNRTFTETGEVGNAIRVTARRDGTSNPRTNLFFARVINVDQFNSTASAVAMANPRDIAFVADLSGSMNDDTEPCWATGRINSQFPQPNNGRGRGRQPSAANWHEARARSL